MLKMRDLVSVLLVFLAMLAVFGLAVFLQPLLTCTAGCGG
jgi:hypothetical protein